MTRKRGRLIASLVVLGGLAVAGVMSFQERLAILELWLLRDFDSLETVGERSDRIEALSRVGGERSASRLVALLPDGELGEVSAEALVEIAPRVSIETRRVMLRALLESDEYLIMMGEIARDPDLLDEVVSRLDRCTPPALPRLARAVFENSRENPSAAGAALDGVTPEQVRELFAPSFRRTRPSRDLWFESDPDASALGRDLAQGLLRHRDARVRAVALCARAPLDETGSGCDPSVLERAYRRDDAFVVRRAAVRLAGYVGLLGSDGFDLRRLVRSESDVALLVEIVQALTVGHGAGRGEPADGFELWDGFVCSWISRHRERIWSEATLDRLRRLLDTSRDPALRDACSLALASRDRGNGVPARKTPVLGFRYHEWGVWNDEAAPVLSPPASELASLPEFVHRTRITADVLRDVRVEDRRMLDVLKPVVHFYAPRPIVAFMRVQFGGGQPWTFFPEATDYTQALASTVPRGGAARPPAGAAPNALALPGSAETAIEPRPVVISPPGAAPEWLRSTFQSQSMEAFDELRRRYDLAPWLAPSHPRLRIRPFTSGLTDLGLEWCGLRIGFDAAFEADPPEPPRGSWWHHLRAVPSSDVAIRGERERFLFYDGSVTIPGPVTPVSVDEARSALILRVTSFDSMPYERELGIAHALPAVFVVRVRDDVPRGAVRRELLHSGEGVRVELDALDLVGPDLVREFESALESQGLTAAETRSIIATWSAELFETDGLRVLTVLPRWVYDAALPLTIYPVPEEIVRVGVVCRECDELVVAKPKPAARPSWKAVPWSMPVRIVRARKFPYVAEPEQTLERVDGGGVVVGSRGRIAWFSTDAKRVAIQVKVDYASDIVLGDLERGTSRRVARFSSKYYLNGISVSNDETRLAYGLRDRASKAATLRLIDFARGLEYAFDGMSSPRISGDGRRLLCRWGTDFVSIDLASGVFSFEGRVLLTTPGSVADHGSAMSRDGRVVAVAWNGAVWLIDARGAVTNLSHGVGKATGGVRISADGRRVLWGCEWERDRELFLSDVVSQTVINATRRRGTDLLLDLSADGSRFVYRAKESDACFAVDVEGGSSRQVQGMKGASAVRLAPDGKHVVAVRGSGTVRYVSIEPIE